jgi:hypothetical protein
MGKSFGKYLLVFLLGFLSIGAFYGGISFLMSPDGSMLQLPGGLLEGSVFNNYTVPGIILLVSFGILPLFTVYCLQKKPAWSLCELINLVPDHHFSWTFTVYIGIGQVIWINIQTLIINQVYFLHTALSSLGILIVCISLLPSVRREYARETDIAGNLVSQRDQNNIQSL